MLDQMSTAIKEARKALKLGEVPIGAVLVDAQGKILARAHNLRESKQNPLGHAELLAIAKAAKKLKQWRLLGTTLYVTLEPCAMCWGAIVLARIGKVVFGTYDPKAGVCGGAIDLREQSCFNHHPQVEAGRMQAECAALLSNFFAALRKNKKRDI